MPAGVAVMGDGLGQTTAARKRGHAALLLRADLPRKRRSDGADVAEQLFQEAALTAERRRLAVRRANVHHQLLAGTLDRGDVTLLVEADDQRRLVRDLRIAERDCVDVA